MASPARAAVGVNSRQLRLTGRRAASWRSGVLAKSLADLVSHPGRSRIVQFDPHGTTGRNRTAWRRSSAQLHQTRPIKGSFVEAWIPRGFEDVAAGNAVIGAQAHAHDHLLTPCKVAMDEKGNRRVGEWRQWRGRGPLRSHQINGRRVPAQPVAELRDGCAVRRTGLAGRRAACTQHRSEQQAERHRNPRLVSRSHAVDHTPAPLRRRAGPTEVVRLHV